MSGYACAWGDDNHGARFIFTDLTTGASLAYCDEHFPPGMLPIIAAELGVDPLKFYEHTEKFLARQVAAERKAAKQAATEVIDDLAAGHETFHDVGEDLRAERKAGPGNDEPTMGSGQVADDDEESLFFDDEEEYMNAYDGDDE